ncbi:MAG: CRTAC1 family protein [Planctomycetota bacterium]|jgi:hypothetical protein
MDQETSPIRSPAGMNCGRKSLGMMLWLCAAVLAASCKPDPANQQSNPAPGTTGGKATGRHPGPGSGWFRDVTESSGLAFVHRAGNMGKYYFPENMGAGGALFDADNDGDLDVFLVQAGQVPATTSGAPAPDVVFLNDGSGVFERSPKAVPSGESAYGMGCATGDYDNDGDLDIYVTNVGSNALMQNDGTGLFRDVTRGSGTDDPGFGTSAAWLDFDRDGWLDLYVTNYIVWSAASEGPCYAETGPRDYCTPMTYPAQADVLYRNEKNGTFRDVSKEAGISSERYNGLGVAIADFNNDGWDDIYVANDQQPNLLWTNQKNGTFRNDALLAGCAVNASGMPEASMGVVAEDLNEDGRIDLFMTHLRGETHTYFRNMGEYFIDDTFAAGLGAFSVRATGFGVGWFDFDRDGWPDMFIANGSVNLGGSPEDRNHPYAERNTLLVGQKDGRFAEACSKGGDICDPIEMSRGAAFGDIDGDGDVDVLVTNNRGRARLYQNIAAQENNWLNVRVRNAQGTDAIGATVSVTARGRTVTRRIRSGSSYLSSSDFKAYFGLGKLETVDEVVATWPDGSKLTVTGVDSNQELALSPPG